MQTALGADGYGNGRTFCHYQISAGRENLAIDIIVGGSGPGPRTQYSVPKSHSRRCRQTLEGGAALPPEETKTNPPSIRREEPWLTLGQFGTQSTG